MFGQVVPGATPGILPGTAPKPVSETVQEAKKDPSVIPFVSWHESKPVGPKIFGKHLFEWPPSPMTLALLFGLGGIVLIAGIAYKQTGGR